jgi:hypothetical protein
MPAATLRHPVRELACVVVWLPPPERLTSRMKQALPVDKGDGPFYRRFTHRRPASEQPRRGAGEPNQRGVDCVPGDQSSDSGQW